MEDNYVKFDLENSDSIATVCLIIRELCRLVISCNLLLKLCASSCKMYKDSRIKEQIYSKHYHYRMTEENYFLSNRIMTSRIEILTSLFPVARKKMLRGKRLKLKRRMKKKKMMKRMTVSIHQVSIKH